MKITTHLAHHFQSTRLYESLPYSQGKRRDGILTLSDAFFQKDLRRRLT
jgi:hypothetical protein